MSDDESYEWWSRRRFAYNGALLIAGPVAFLGYAAAFQVSCLETPGAEITIFTTAFQGFGYLVAIGIANICYNFGFWLEQSLRPADIQRYRRVTYWAGLWFSVALPFTIPLITLMYGCRVGTD